MYNTVHLTCTENVQLLIVTLIYAGHE